MKGCPSTAARLVITLSLLAFVSSGCERSACVCPGGEDRPIEASITYLFREAWGDCPAGCTANRYWYFECTPESCTYIGVWDAAAREPRPDWWEQARVAMFYFQNGHECPYSLWNDCEDVSKTPRENSEAEEAAIWLSGSLVAPDTLYFTILTNLQRIRDGYGDDIPQLRTISFYSIWRSSAILVRLTSAAMDRYNNGQFRDLDSLNTALGLIEMEHMWQNLFLLTFKGRLNNKRLVEIYEPLPCILHAEPDGYGGDWPNVYPWVELELD